MNQMDLQKLIDSANYAAATARKALEIAEKNAAADAAMLRGHQEMTKNAQMLAQTVAQMSAQRTGGNPNLQYIENIPGRRVPFDVLVTMPIGASVTGIIKGSFTVNQDGPFVAVSRMAAFLSQAQFQYTNPEDSNTAIFNGRSYGRWRPVHSAWDLYDGVPRSEVVQAVAAPGSGAPHIISPSNASSWRSMQPDFSIELRNDGSGYPRSNQPVPSPFYTKQINSPFNLGALDFFERGEVMTFEVQPMHPSNPAYGNVQSFTGSGNAWPFLASQYDAVEGISDPALNNVTTDPVTRNYDGFLVIGLHGYKIIQPPGAGPY